MTLARFFGKRHTRIATGVKLTFRPSGQWIATCTIPGVQIPPRVCGVTAVAARTKLYELVNTVYHCEIEK